jgi:DNA-binding transcriptional LysR family regulator
MVWVRGPTLALDSLTTVPLVSYGDECMFYRTAISALNRMGVQSELVYSGSSIAGLCAAVAAGLGVMVLPRSRIDMPDLIVCDDSWLPKLPEVSCGIYLRDGGGREVREHIAQVIAEALSPRAIPNPRISNAAQAVASPAA